MAADGTDGEATRVKRSRTVSLVLVAGAGAAAVGLARLDPTQREEDVLVYPTAEACAAARVRTEADCADAFAAARAAYPAAAPRYDTVEACERHHGRGHCLPGELVTRDAHGRAVPLMAAVLMGRTAEQDLAPQPVYEHAPQDATAAAAGYGGYCTGTGGRVWTSGAGRGTSARVASASVRGTAFGGFGGTGRSFAAHGASAHASSVSGS